MATFPSFYHQNLYKKIRQDFSPGESWEKFPEFGIYKIWGRTSPCKYPIIFRKVRNDAMQPCQGDVDGVWTTGFELNEALESGEFTPKIIDGYYYESWNDPDKSPFAEFAKDLFELKNTAPDNLRREFYKVILNSISGKLIETRKFNSECEFGYDENLNKVLDGDVRKVGQLFNSFIAALITGHTRAHIHRLEHKYEAIHTSTDGIFVLKKPSEVAGLGGVKIDFRGDLLIVRNKVYLGYTEVQEFDAQGRGALLESVLLPGRFIKKAATHAFYARPAGLEALILKYQNETPTKNGFAYKFQHVNKVKETLKSRKSKARIERGEPERILNNFVQQDSSMKNVDFRRILEYRN
jgi:hypothetical protein